MTATAWKLPGYLVQQQLGAGGSGQVWQARERSTGDEVAVKLLPAVERGHLDAVRSEAAMLSGLDHPHLLHLREVVQCGAGLALVVDLADGGSLAELLDSRGRIAPGEVVTAIAPIGAALAYAHNAGVVHGDVSASNLLFTEIGFPLLADLGVARLVGDDAPVSSTPAYLDPAVAAGGVPSAASDVFMLGAVALHALTGEPAWRGVTAEEALIAARAGDLGDLPARMNAARVPGEVADVVSRALELEASRRPTAAEFALDLRHATEPVAVEFGAGRAADRDSDAGGRPRADRSTFTHHMRPEPRRPAPKG
ncbi:MAG: serine/threonine-protein kinase, partial [Sciscionella sp.]